MIRSINDHAFVFDRSSDQLKIFIILFTNSTSVNYFLTSPRFQSPSCASSEDCPVNKCCRFNDCQDKLGTFYLPFFFTSSTAQSNPKLLPPPISVFEGPYQVTKFPKSLAKTPKVYAIFVSGEGATCYPHYHVLSGSTCPCLDNLECRRVNPNKHQCTRRSNYN